MIQFTTTIKPKEKEVVVSFRNEYNTFSYDGKKFSIGEALKVAAEFMETRLIRREGSKRSSALAAKLSKRFNGDGIRCRVCKRPLAWVRDEIGQCRTEQGRSICVMYGMAVYCKNQEVR